MLALVPLLLTLAAPPGGATIEGTVRDQGGTPLAGAVIVAALRAATSSLVEPLRADETETPRRAAGEVRRERIAGRGTDALRPT